MKERQVNPHNLQEFFLELQNELKETQSLVVSTQPAGAGKWGMARLWRMWIAATAKFMAGNGVTMPLMIAQDGSYHGSRPFDANDGHELFSQKFLPQGPNGERLSWSKSGRDGMRAATKGERYTAMMRLEEWMGDKGIQAFKPSESEYEKLRQEQER